MKILLCTLIIVKVILHSKNIKLSLGIHQPKMIVKVMSILASATKQDQ